MSKQQAHELEPLRSAFENTRYEREAAWQSAQDLYTSNSADTDALDRALLIASNAYHRHEMAADDYFAGRLRK